MRIKWVPATIQGVVYEKAGLTFDLQVVGIFEKVTVQLDSGAFRSVAYVPRDSTASELSIHLAGLRKELPTIKNSDSDDIKILLGVDLLKDLYVVLDFENDTIVFSTNIVDTGYKFTQGTPDKLGRLILPLIIKDQIVQVMVDTGASLFDVSSTETLARRHLKLEQETIRQFALPPNTHPDGNRELLFKIYKVSTPVKLGRHQKDNFEISIHNSKNPSIDFAQYEPPIFGLIGLTFFKNQKKLLIDFKEFRLGIL